MEILKIVRTQKYDCILRLQTLGINFLNYVSSSFLLVVQTSKLSQTKERGQRFAYECITYYRYDNHETDSLSPLSLSALSSNKYCRRRNM